MDDLKELIDHPACCWGYIDELRMALASACKERDELKKQLHEAKSELAKYREAEQDGRLVVLPCKVGDTVYMPVWKWGTITGYEADECDGFHIARDGVLQIKAKCYSCNHGTYGVPGKTVFLTREEAEAALAGKGEKNE